MYIFKCIRTQTSDNKMRFENAILETKNVSKITFLVDCLKINIQKNRMRKKNLGENDHNDVI